MLIESPRIFLESMFKAAIKAADPAIAMRKNLPAPPRGRTVVIGVGKASAQMARTLEEIWDGPLTGVVVTRYGFSCETKAIRVIEASHPVPDAAGMAATTTLIEAIQNLTPDDLVIALISGGGSALLPAPPHPMTLEDEASLNRLLLASGAPIAAMNTIRRHLSMVKGGRLATKTKAPVVTFVVSDIPGDNPAFVASGPTIPDWSTPQDALDLIKLYGLNISEAAMAYLKSDRVTSPKPDDIGFRQNSHYVVASARLSLDAAAAFARETGSQVIILSDSIEGESRDIGQMHAAIAREALSREKGFPRPILFLSGGETTVTLRSKGGRGGRNSEFALAAAIGIQDLDIHILAADTDGIDGSENNAGAFADGSTVKRLRHAGIDPRDALLANDSYGAFAAIGDLFVPGPTGTNVNDFRAILIR